MDSYRSSSERLEAAAAAAHYRAAGAAPPLAAPRHVHHPPGAPPRQRGPSSSHGASRSNSGSEVYERMPSAGGAGNGQAHRGHLEVSDDDSEYNSSMDRRGEMLVKPSQIKKNRSQGEIRDEYAALERSEMMFAFSLLFFSCPPLPPSHDISS